MGSAGREQETVEKRRSAGADSPLHDERVLLLRAELRVDLDGIIFFLQLQHLLPELLCHQLAIIDDSCAETESRIVTNGRLATEMKARILYVSAARFFYLP